MQTALISTSNNDPSQTLNEDEDTADEGEEDRGDMSTKVCWPMLQSGTQVLICGGVWMQESIIQRKVELASLQSSLASQSRLVSPFIRLKFQSPPVSPNDPPTELERSDHQSSEFILHRGWVARALQKLVGMSNVGDDVADRHLAAMIRDFKAEATRLDRLEETAWQKEMLTSGALHMDIPGVRWPVPVEPGTS